MVYTTSIFVSHVSPGKEPLLTRLMLHFMPNFWISGHMGAPFACVWNQFTIHEMDEALDWLQVDTAFIEEQYKLGHLSDEAILAYEIVKRDIPKKDDWFKKMWNINLPDAKDASHGLIHIHPLLVTRLAQSATRYLQVSHHGLIYAQAHGAPTHKR